MTRWQKVGLACGASAGILLLAAASIWLLSTPETSTTVLVAVWLWALPVLGITSLTGWLIARLLVRGGTP